MDTTHIAELLQPFLAAPVPGTASKELPFRAGFSPREPALSGSRGESAVLSNAQLQNISMYIDILLRWNARINLTAVRQPEHIVTRHFGESLFAARHLFPDPRVRTDTPAAGPPHARSQRPPAPRVLDIGSGAGFPGLPLKIWAPEINLTLIESNHKKATFLREVTRALTLTDVDVFPGRAEDLVADAEAAQPDLAGEHISTSPRGDVVTLRAVERFDSALPVAARLVSPGGRLVLFIGQSQISRALALAPDFRWQDPVSIPLSSTRVLLLGVRSF
jgi:16S rRNA (guanine527-N7)-methyltransferase